VFALQLAVVAAVSAALLIKCKRLLSSEIVYMLLSASISGCCYQQRC
jgi:hypothetical protein